MIKIRLTVHTKPLSGMHGLCMLSTEIGRVRRGGTVQYSSFHVRVKVCSSSNLPLHYSIVLVGLFSFRKYRLASSPLESIGWPLLN
jgi:hypothetical protein